MLLLMKLAKPTAPALVPAAAQVKRARTTLGRKSFLPAIVKEDRRPAESEIRAPKSSSQGIGTSWGITEDGNELGPELIRQRFAQGGRVQFAMREIGIVNPKTEGQRIMSYRVDPAKFPSQIDVTSQFDGLLKGIYKFEGNQLLICLARHEDDARPTEFEARGGSDRALFRLQLSRPASRPDTPAASPPQPSPAEEATSRSELARRMMVGSWTTTDLRGTLTIVFRADGTFSATRIWSKLRKPLLGFDSDTSDGTWRLLGGWLDVFVSSTTDKRLTGRHINLRVREIGDASMVVSDQLDTRQTLNKQP